LYLPYGLISFQAAVFQLQRDHLVGVYELAAKRLDFQRDRNICLTAGVGLLRSKYQPDAFALSKNFLTLWFKSQFSAGSWFIAFQPSETNEYIVA